MYVRTLVRGLVGMGGLRICGVRRDGESMVVSPLEYTFMCYWEKIRCLLACSVCRGYTTEAMAQRVEISFTVTRSV